MQCLDWIALPQDRDKWLAVLNTAMYLRVPKDGLAEELFASQDALYSMELQGYGTVKLTSQLS